MLFDHIDVGCESAPSWRVFHTSRFPPDIVAVDCWMSLPPLFSSFEVSYDLEATFVHLFVFQGDEEESEDDADYAPDARGGSDAESSSDSDDEDQDSDDGARKKSKKRSGSGSAKKGASKKQVLCVCVCVVCVHPHLSGVCRHLFSAKNTFRCMCCFTFGVRSLYN